MALGKIAVITEAPGVRDHVIAGDTALVVPPGDPDRLAEALSWASDPDNADAQQRMRRRAREDVLERFTPERYVDSLLSVISRLRT